MSDVITLSSMPKTWIFDLDGTLVKHNGYKIDGTDYLLDGVKEFFENLSTEDMVIIFTARSSKYKVQTIEFLRKSGVRFNHIIFDVPFGERVLINDKKPSGLLTAYSINQNRDQFIKTKIIIDESL